METTDDVEGFSPKLSDGIGSIQRHRLSGTRGYSDTLRIGVCSTDCHSRSRKETQRLAAPAAIIKQRPPAHVVMLLQQGQPDALPQILIIVESIFGRINLVREVFGCGL